MSQILLIDDEVELCKALAAFLELSGYEALCLHSGNDAIEALKEKDFDLVLSDIRMPNGSGIELGEWMHVHRSNIPLVFFSGAPGQDRELPGSLSHIPCLLKPLDHKKLIEQIEQSLSCKVLEK